MQWYVSAYSRLNSSRQYGMSGPLPISVSEIIEYCHAMDIHDPNEVMEIVDIIQQIDQEVLPLIAEGN